MAPATTTAPAHQDLSSTSQYDIDKDVLSINLSTNQNSSNSNSNSNDDGHEVGPINAEDVNPEEVLDDMYRTLTIDGQGGNKDLEKVPTLPNGQPVPVSDIPDKFSGWGLASVMGCWLFNLNTWGSNSAYALYLQDYLNNDVFPGSQKMDYGIIGGLTFGAGLTLGPLVNYCVGLIGIRSTICLGIAIQFIGTMLASFSTKLWHVYCSQGVLQGIGMALICIPNVNIIPQWFSGGKHGKRNVAMGITAAGSGIGGIIYNAGMQPLLKDHTFRWSMRTQSIMCAVLNIVAVCLIKSRNKHIKPIYKVFDRQVWTNFGCLLIMVWIMFTLFGYVALMYNLGDFTRSLGCDSHQASVVSTMTSVGIIYGRPCMGQLADKIGPINTTIIASWLVALFALAMWIPCRNYATAIVFSLFEGSLMGTIWVTLATVGASIIGLRKLGIAMAVSWIGVGLFGFASPIIGIALKSDGPQRPEQYQNAAIFVGMCYFAAGFALIILRGWLIKRNELCPNLRDENALLSVRVPFGQGLKSILTFKPHKV